MKPTYKQIKYLQRLGCNIPKKEQYDLEIWWESNFPTLTKEDVSDMIDSIKEIRNENVAR